MTDHYVLKTQIEKLLQELCKDTNSLGPFCIGRFIVSPVYWGEHEQGYTVIDSESTLEVFHNYVNHELEDDFFEE